MIISEKGLSLIKQFEGLVLHPYRDSAGIPTIGYGSTRWLTGKKVQMNDFPIDEETATNLLRKVAEDVSHQIDALTIDNINQNQFDALVSFAYNVGVPAYQGSTLRKRVNANPSDSTIRDAFKMWNKITVDGELKPLDALTKRREKEADYYFS